VVCDALAFSGTFTDTLALGRDRTVGEQQTSGRIIADSQAAAAKCNADEVASKATVPDGDGSGLGPWKLAPAETSNDDVSAAAAVAAAATPAAIFIAVVHSLLPLEPVASHRY
jgi:hypothetical protein